MIMNNKKNKKKEDGKIFFKIKIKVLIYIYKEQTMIEWNNKEKEKLN